MLRQTGARAFKTNLVYDFGYGAIYKITTTGAFSVVTTNFDSETHFPNFLVQGNNGVFYGTTYGGYSYDGSYIPSSFFKIESGGKITVLPSSDFGSPNGLVKGKDGNFYTICGSTFTQMAPDGTVSYLNDLSGSLNGGFVNPLMCGKDGAFYGTFSDNMSGGGAFSITTNGEYASWGSFPALPLGALVQDAKGNFYGLTKVYFGDGFGVLKIASDGTSTLCWLDSSHFGPSQPVGLAIDNSGNLITCSQEGGGSKRGALIKISPEGYSMPLVWFEGISDKAPGAHPSSNLVKGKDGNLYGITVCDIDKFGSHFRGNLFKLAQATPPTIVSQPENSTNALGSEAIFSVGVIGDGTLKYQWQKNGVNIVNSTRVSGATSSTLKIRNLAASDRRPV